MTELKTPMHQWFAKRGWEVFAFQAEAWAAYAAGKSGLIHAPTGMGKTLAAFGGVLNDGVAGVGYQSLRPGGPQTRRGGDVTKGVQSTLAHAGGGGVLWVTPLRALAGDTVKNLGEAVEGVGLDWRVEARTGDTSAYLKKKQRAKLPEVLVTTPESLSLLLSYPDTVEQLRQLSCVVVDEWHELMGSKRGVQTELGLARLRAINETEQGLRTWGLSATLGNLDEAMRVLLGEKEYERGLMIEGGEASVRKDVDVVTLLPGEATGIKGGMERFPWSGHVGTKLVDGVVDAIAEAKSSLLFTNTRAQAELWYQAILKAKPEWVVDIALHHGSIDRKLRQGIEEMLRRGEMRCVVCTSSLDLGVDFSEVDRVFQVGSPKGIARLMQRAGRSGHRPGEVSLAYGVPTNAFELVEFAAARDALHAREIEARRPLKRSLDVLVQHLITIAAGCGEAGFNAEALLAEIRATHAYAELSDQQWEWAMKFVMNGGDALTAYPQYQKVLLNEEGQHVIHNDRTAKMHRMGIGTITGDTALSVKFINGKTLGTVEEGFAGKLQPGSRFVFSGRVLKVKQIKQMTIFVERAKQTTGMVSTWNGAKAPLSTQLAGAVRRKLDEALAGKFNSAEMKLVEPILKIQREWSVLPSSDEFLMERYVTKDGHHWILFPFAGRLVHEGLGVLLAWRITQRLPRSITATCNDYGIELLCDQPIELDEAAWREVLSTENLVDDLLACLNASQLARSRFRVIARIAGLIQSGYPGERRSMRQLQASSELFFEVFEQFDAGNELLKQARDEVLEQELELLRMRETLTRLETQRMVVRSPKFLTPMSFGIWADRIRASTLSSESWQERVEKMVVQLEKEAG